MNKKFVSEAMKQFGGALSRNSQTLLTATSVISMLAALGLSVDATAKAVKTVESEEERLGRKLTKSEVVAFCWHYYIWVAVLAAASAGSAIASNEVNLRKNAALTAALEATKAAAITEGKVLPFGEKKESDDKEDAETRTINNINVSERMEFYEPLCGQYFYSTVADIMMAVNQCNLSLVDWPSCQLDEFYRELGIEDVPELAKDYIWTKGDFDAAGTGVLDVYFERCRYHNGHVAIILSYGNEPRMVSKIEVGKF